MNTYEIFHPVGGAMNHECKSATYEYEKIAEIKAPNIEKAFVLSQNDFNEEYAKLNKRSTSVGDIIAIAGDDVFGNYGCDKIPMLVKGIGFQQVTPYWLTYIDWTNK